MNKKYKNTKYYCEYLLLKMIFSVLLCFPASLSSLLLGRVFRFIGPFLKSSLYGKINLNLAFPSKTKKEKKKILADSWENIGRTLAEFPHIPSFYHPTPSKCHWHVKNTHYLDEVRKSGKPIIFFSGHIGNWEILPPILETYQLPFAPFYRAPNNPYIDRYLQKLRQKNTKIRMPLFAKGTKGAKNAMRHLNQKHHLGILGDQKMNDGIEVSFFNRPTMAAPAPAALALRFDALILIGYVERTRPAHFILHLYPPLDTKQMQKEAENRQEALYHITQYLMKHLESWIEKHPSSWLWCHRRWDKSLYQKQKKKR